MTKDYPCEKKDELCRYAETPDYEEKVRELMKEQHKVMIKETDHGKHKVGRQTPQSVPKLPDESVIREPEPRACTGTPASGGTRSRTYPSLISTGFEGPTIQEP